jgi:hypothetical protein
MPLILGTNSIKDTGYDVANSLRFNDGSSDRLNITPSSTGNRKNWTWSSWIKRSGAFGSKITIFGSFEDTNFNNYIHLFFTSADKIELQNVSSGSNTGAFTTDRVFRDPSAWLHLLLEVDTTESTASDRIKLYINGQRETNLSSTANPSVNEDLQINISGRSFEIGAFNSNQYFDGYMTEVVLLDGTSADTSSFGEFDSDSPTIWKPKDVSGLTFGTNGFYLDFENASSLGADVSGNSNNFTVNNLTSVDQSTDTCTNNFATLNPLNVPTSNAPTFSEGNLISSTSDSAQFGGTSTIGVSSGKWYAEFKGAETGGEEKEMVGVTHAPAEDARSGDNVGRTAESFAIRFLDGQQSNNNSVSAYGSAFSIGDICQVALDIDNNNLYFGKNGQWGDGSGNFNQSTPTSAITIPTIANTTEGAYFFSVGDLSSTSGRSLISCNFGSPPFSISSGNSDANGYGNFEYAVPSGYYALNTKNLAEFG